MLQLTSFPPPYPVKDMTWQQPKKPLVYLCFLPMVHLSPQACSYKEVKRGKRYLLSCGSCAGGQSLSESTREQEQQRQRQCGFFDVYSIKLHTVHGKWVQLAHTYTDVFNKTLEEIQMTFARGQEWFKAMAQHALLHTNSQNPVYLQ